MQGVFGIGLFWQVPTSGAELLGVSLAVTW